MNDGQLDHGMAGALLDDPAWSETVPSDTPDPGPEWPPDVVPVFLWPQETLQLALRDAPGPRLARVVAEAIDLAGNLDPDHDRDRFGDGHGREVAAVASDEGAGSSATPPTPPPNLVRYRRWVLNLGRLAWRTTPHRVELPGTSSVGSVTLVTCPASRIWARTRPTASWPIRDSSCRMWVNR